MSVNLDKFKYDLVEGWREVMDTKNIIDWAMFGYDGQSFDLKLVNKGAGGLEQMIENFSSGRIMYALCRVKLKDRNVEKIALINWQGEGAPLARKGTCANHVSTVKSFFKGVHVTINARTDEDVEPEAIISSVAKATSAEGLRMSSSLEMDEKMEPVGATYKRVNPQEEINVKVKDEFWRKEEAEEESRKKVEKGRVVKFSQNEVKLLRKESQDYFYEQEQGGKTVSPTPSPTQSIPTSTNGDFNTDTAITSDDTGMSSPTPPTSPVLSPTFVASEKAAVLKASVPRKAPKENLVRQRIKSFDGNPNESLLTFNAPTTNGGLRSSSKSPAEGEGLSVLKRKQMFESGQVSNITQPIPRKDPALEIKTLQEENQNQKPAPAPASSVISGKSPPPSTISPPPFVPPKSGSTAQLAFSKPQPPGNVVKAYNLPFHIGGSVSSRLAEKINKNSDSNETQNQNGNSLSSADSNNSTVSKQQIEPSSVSVGSNSVVKAEFQAAPIPQHITTNFEQKPIIPPVSSNEVTSITKPPPPPSPTPKDGITNQKMEQVKSEEFEDTTVQSGEISIKSPTPDPLIKKKGKISPSPTPIGTSFEIKPEMGLCARAIYDYQAADESEITFDPGEMITNIETIDEGWWEGMGPHGLYGLFPSNYVELLN